MGIIIIGYLCLQSKSKRERERRGETRDELDPVSRRERESVVTKIENPET